MKIAGHCSDDRFARSAHSAGHKIGSQDLHALFHGSGRHEHLRHKDHSLFELSPYFIHGSYHSGIQNL